MKASMRIRYGLTLMLLGGGVLLMLLAVLTVAFWKEGNGEAVVLCGIAVLILVLCVFCGFHHGIWINGKRVLIVQQNDIRLLDYDTISRILVEFTDTCVTATFILLRQPKYTAIWTDMTGIHWYNRHTIRISRKFIRKSIDSLSQCPKVQIKDLTKRD